jgi:hypothetical protein
MKLQVKLGALMGMLALLAIPTAASAAPTYTPGPDYNPAPEPPKTKPSPPPHAKAYGRYCQGKSKKHVKGEKGTEFSRCVKAMARAGNQSLKPKKACKGLSKKHVKGEKGTEFSRCVKAAAKLRRDQRREEREATASSKASAGGPKGVKGPDYTPAPPPPPGPKAGLPEKAKAYGRYCQGASKEHVDGEPGTAFSRCITAMAKAAQSDSIHPRKACKGLSKKHVKGEKGTEFSRCVKAAARMRKTTRTASNRR